MKSRRVIHSVVRSFRFNNDSALIIISCVSSVLSAMKVRTFRMEVDAF